MIKVISASADEMTVACEDCGAPIRMVRRQLPGTNWSYWVDVDGVDQSTANS